MAVPAGCSARFPGSAFAKSLAGFEPINLTQNGARETMQNGESCTNCTNRTKILASGKGDERMSPPTRVQLSKQATAFHEAGHAVVAHLLQHPLKSVTVVPNKS